MGRQQFQAMMMYSLLVLVPLLAFSPLAYSDPNQIWAAVPSAYPHCADTICKTYLNIHTVCDAKSGNGNFVPTKPELEQKQKDYLNCTCSNPKFLDSVKECDTCSGNNSYPSSKSDCEKFLGTTPASTKSESTGTSEPTGGTPLPVHTSSSGIAARALWSEYTAQLFTASLACVVAVFAGVV